MNTPNTPIESDIFAYGFDKNLNRENIKQDNPLIYNIIEERLSRLTQSGETISKTIPGFPEVEI